MEIFVEQRFTRIYIINFKKFVNKLEKNYDINGEMGGIYGKR